MILCCGEALIDFVPLKDGSGYRPLPGGSIFNTAVALGRLDIPVGLFTRLSTDFFGQMLADTLEENGVQTRYLVRAPGPTTLAFVSLPGEGDVEPQYLFYALGSTDRSLDISDLPAELPQEIRSLHFGSISLVLEPGAAVLEAFMEREASRRIISLDPNIRPGLIPDRDAYRSRFDRWVGVADILRLSAADFEWIYPGSSIEQKARDWVESGLSLCLLTNGARGASAYSAKMPPIFAAAPSVEVADTVGAGDTFMAACLAYLQRKGFLSSRDALAALQESDINACLSYGVKAAAINCSRPGANPPYQYEMV